MREVVREESRSGGSDMDKNGRRKRSTALGRVGSPSDADGRLNGSITDVAETRFRERR